ncbi:unnamed protein product, partial [Mesorhabditis belari]|uniref:Ubiquitin carboxyl-terminal hydrolase n=1 Tax=Mesorhabditis belari TaxID=2138241 RepID=A0AAF3EJV2_9BILA
MACAHLHNVSIAQVNLEQLKISIDDSRRNRTTTRRLTNNRSRDEDHGDHRWNCVACGAGAHPWMCLSCGLIHCSRSENRDALRHYELYRNHSLINGQVKTMDRVNHCIAMSCNDTSVFCYECDDFIGDDTDDNKIHSVRKSLQLFNKARSADHLYSSIAYESYLEDDSDSPADEGTEEEDISQSIVIPPQPSIFVVDEESGSVPEDEVSIGSLSLKNSAQTLPILHVSASAPTLGKESVVKGGHLLRARKRKISPEKKELPTPVAFDLEQEPVVVDRRRGLANLGNTCFMNSVLQALTSVDWFREFMVALPLLEADSVETPDSRAKRPFYCTRRASAQLLNDDDNKKSLTPIFAEVLRQTIHEIFTNKSSSVQPAAFFQEVWRLNPRFRGFQQQDSHEFLRMMLDRVHSDLRKCRIPEDVEKRFARSCGNSSMGATESAISRLFEGALLSQVICLTCRSASNIQDPFLDLSLEMPSPLNRSQFVSLADCIKQFFAKEELDHCEQYMCAKCGERRPSTKQLFLKSLPNVLCLHLKRFRWGTHRGKLDYMVDFPLDGLDLTPYLAPSAGRAQSHLYTLCSIIVHQGSGVSSGHYTTYGLSGGTWWHFNDDRVKPTTDTTVLRQKAYLLFYMKQQK